jgi:hypothetical protein
MAPLPDNNTPVLFVDYGWSDETRTTQFRGAAGADIGSMVALAAAFFNAIAPRMVTGWAFRGFRWRAQGANISLPVEGVPTPVTGIAALDAQYDPRFVSWVGRGAVSGRRVRVFVYGLVFPMPDDYRFTTGDIAEFDAARTVLDTFGAGYATTIAGDDPTWYLYQNVGYNSYHERNQRG